MSTLSPSPSAACSTTSPGSPSEAHPYTEDSDSWTREQEKLFETALSVHELDIPERWENVAALVPGKDADAIMRHYAFLVEDVNNIDLGNIVLPSYPIPSESGLEPVVDSDDSSYIKNSIAGDGTSNGSGGNVGSGKAGNGNNKSTDQERRKGISE